MMTQSLPTRRRTGRLRRAAAGVTCTVALLGGAVVTATPAPAEPALTSALDARIAPDVRSELDSGVTDVWVRMTANADTSRARTQGDRTARGEQVLTALQGTADRSQSALRQYLDGEGLEHQAFWITNAVRVEDVSLAQARSIAAVSGVAEIRAPVDLVAYEPVSSQPAPAVTDGLEWGVANIRANGVWDTYGARGEGIVIGSIDTGVQFDHPALVRQYRGNNGDGTFDHNYNWFDAQGTCPDAPCDTDGHGTHTMGTMVGDDGAGNQIGVAPGAKWITASGCCPSNEALFSSAQWMLAPTDLRGRNPDASTRPHVINNSWGTRTPSTDPFFEDIEQAWADSGIFGVWSNGNNGPTCDTSGAPGSRTISYSVGAYDEANRIANFSSRGPGQDGEIKPNIAAPGVDVRSSVPGGEYGLNSGTSMAAPHVTGAIALLWSAKPSLSRDLAATRATVDTTAVDTPADQCGGTPQDNNVFGEGRLDALAMADFAAGGVGRLTGTVTGADTGAPLAGAAVRAVGPLEREVRTAADGTFLMFLSPGGYQVTIGGTFGYGDSTGSVQMSDATTTTHDVVLAPLPKVEITGAVTDGSGRGGPLPATVSAGDGKGHEMSTRTDPATGRYTLPVVPDTTYTMDVTADVPGYLPARREVVVGTSPLTENVALLVDPLSCDAAGYRPILIGATEGFERTGRDQRWRVTNRDPRYPGYDNDPGWLLDNPGRRANSTGGSGRFAIVDSDNYGQHHVQDTVLTSPTLNLTRAGSPVVRFATDLNPAVNSTATVELSTDGGRKWTTVWRNAGFPGARGPRTLAVALPQAAGKKVVQVRFHFVGQWSMWWQVDDVFVGNQVCEPVP